jgi:hypothetical protein
MKRQELTKQRLMRHLLQPAYARMAVLLTVLLLAAVAIGKPITTMARGQGGEPWTKAVVVEADKSCAVGRDAAQDFGRQLDTLADFYETLISLLLAVVAVVAGLAFWTVKVVSRNQAEETAQAAAEKIIGGHDGFSNKLRDAISTELGDRLEELLGKIEELEERTIARAGEQAGNVVPKDDNGQ